MSMATPIEAARILGGTKPLAVRTLALWRKTGTGPRFIRVGRNIRYPLEGLKAYLEKRTEGGE